MWSSSRRRASWFGVRSTEQLIGWRLALSALALILTVETAAAGKPEDGFPAGLPGCPKIDAYTPAGPLSRDEERGLLAVLERWNLRRVVVATGDPADSPGPRERIEAAAALHAAYPRRIGWVSTLDFGAWGAPDWDSVAVAGIERDAARGALGVQIGTAVGMRLRDPDGRFVLVDDPRFEPVLRSLERLGLTLVLHSAEPRSSWLALESIDSQYERGFFWANPERHAFLHPELPDYWTLLAARDRLLEAHPKLRVVGSHLASLEFDLDEAGAALERHPNLALDLAGRLYCLQRQPPARARAFLLKHRGRILYASGLAAGGAAAVQLGAGTAGPDSTYSRDLRYFATSARLTDCTVQGEFKGLTLPDSVLRRILYRNAKQWFPGLQD